MLMPMDKGLREKINFLNELYILYCCLTSLVTMIATVSRGVKYLVPQFLHSVQFGVRGPKTSVAYFDWKKVLAISSHFQCMPPIMTYVSKVLKWVRLYSPRLSWNMDWWILLKRWPDMAIILWTLWNTHNTKFETKEPTADVMRKQEDRHRPSYRLVSPENFDHRTKQNKACIICRSMHISNKVRTLTNFAWPAWTGRYMDV